MDNSNRRLAKNTAFLYLRMFFALFVSLYTSRVILSTLGVIDYGIYNVIAGFVSLFAFVNSTLSASMQRFYNYFIGSKNLSGLSQVYTLGLVVHCVFALILIFILETFGLWYVNSIMVFPEERLVAANILFQVVIFSSILVMLQIPFVGAVMAFERMDYYALISIIDVVFKLLIVIVLPYIPADSLIIYAILLMCVGLFNFIMYVVYVKRNFKTLKICREKDVALYKEILSFSGWNLLGTFAFMLKGQGINMLLNVFFGPVVNAARGIAFQAHSAISSFSSNITVAYRPQLVNAYASDNLNRANKLFISESKICFCLILILATPVILEVEYILHLWLGAEVPKYTSMFTILSLIDLLICILNPPCTQIVQATGKLKYYQIASSIVNLGLIPFCWILLKMNFDANAVFVATIMFSILNQAVCLKQTHKVFRFDFSKYCRDVIFPCFVITIFLPIIPFVIHYILEESFGRLIIITISDVLIAFPLIYYVILDESEKEFIKIYVMSKLKSYSR